MIKEQWKTVEKENIYMKEKEHTYRSETWEGSSILQREITREELDEIYSDFDSILIQDGVLPEKESRHQFVAEENGRIIGLASGLMHHQWFYLSDLWVRKEYRDRGLGSYLLTCLEDKVYRLGARHIYTWTSGPRNPVFYENRGYRIFTVFENYYGIDHYPQMGYRKDL